MSGLILAGLVGGIAVGLTGMGGGALLTPLLVLFFGVPPSAAVSSDLLVSLCMKPVGGLVHWRSGSVRTDVVRWLALGSVPSAFVGAVLLDRVGGDNVDELLHPLLGAALLLAATATTAKTLLLGGRAAPPATAKGHPVHAVRPVATLAIGTLGGLLVGLTSVGSGSLMLVSLLVLYPRLTSAELVGTDLVQAVPLVAAATLGHAFFGSIQLDLAGALLVGALPGVWVGARLSARAPERLVRPAVVTVLAASGLKLLNVV